MENITEAKNEMCIMRRKQLELRLGIARSTIYDRLNPKSPRYDARFPKPIKLSKCGAIGFLSHEVERYIEILISENRG